MQKSHSSICFIVNPAAGKGDRQTLHRIISGEAEARWHTSEVVNVQANDSVSELAKRKAQTFDIIVACGGDGTVNSVVSGLAETNATLGVLPIGTGNDFAKAIQVRCSLTRCFEILQHHPPVPIDLIRYSGDADGWCVNTLGLGLDGLANYYSKSYKWLSGPIVYVLGAIKSAWKFRGSQVQLNVDGDRFSEKLLMMTACNGKWEGGKFYLAPDADLTDGLINFITIKKISFLKILFYLPFFRWGPQKWMKELKTELSREIDILSELPLAVHADGEHAGSEIRNLKINIVPGALKVITGY
ncbi:diacylglycerol/lipid kinase family protein [Rhodohalobacter halophilus]|uniref:diacylglycerol/lipid kinase family protein n=1 Tax=Rhodohalobacter halophilus TaxID=1812810 RepID=UPI000A0585A8|nr:diacylglycerol kinase family protein [Rhodohalobacter halophilus]